MFILQTTWDELAPIICRAVEEFIIVPVLNKISNSTYLSKGVQFTYCYLDMRLETEIIMGNNLMHNVQPIPLAPHTKISFDENDRFTPLYIMAMKSNLSSMCNTFWTGSCNAKTVPIENVCMSMCRTLVGFQGRSWNNILK